MGIMSSVNNKITVLVDLSQKDKMIIDGIEFYTALKFDSNYREKSPTIATVVEGNEIVKSGDVLLCHHNLFYLPSPYHLYDELFSIPFSNILFAKISSNMGIEPICGNIICNRISIEADMLLPVELRKTHDKVYKVFDSREMEYNNGDIIFTRPRAGYDIVYNHNGEEKRITKVHKDQICAVLKPTKL